MILNCPACNARFVVEAATFPPAGRQVRCGVCSHAWHQMPEDAEPEAIAEAFPESLPEDVEAFDDEAAAQAGELDAADGAPAPDAAAADGAGESEGDSAMARLEAFDESRRRSEEDFAGLDEERKAVSLFTVAWLALLVFVLAVAAIAWFGRDAVVAQFPEAGKLYAKLGIETVEPARVGEGLEVQDVKSVKREVDGKRLLMIEGAVVNVSDQARPVPLLRAVIIDAEGSQITEWILEVDSESLPPGGRVRFETSTEDPERGVNLNLIFVER